MPGNLPIWVKIRVQSPDPRLPIFDMESDPESPDRSSDMLIGLVFNKNNHYIYNDPELPLNFMLKLMQENQKRNFLNQNLFSDVCLTGIFKIMSSKITEF